MNMHLRVLIAEDCGDDALLLEGVLRRSGFDLVLERVETKDAMRTALLRAQWDVVLADYNMPQLDVREGLALAREFRSDIPFIVVSGSVGEEKAVELMHDGATDLILKGNLSRLVPAILRELENTTHRSTQREAESALRKAQKLEAVGQLSSGIAHDFNNILGIIIGNLDIQIEMLDAHEEALELGTEALRAALRGAQLVHRLLAFSRNQPLQPKAFDLGSGVRDVESLLRRTLGEHMIIEIQVSDELWPVMADPSQVENAILNLAINARDAMPDGGCITIACANATLDESSAAECNLPVADYVTLSVNDTGLGIAPDTLLRVFEPFFTTKEEGKGTGLGLSMVHGFARQSGGDVRIYSELGHGTEVRIYLPRAAGTPVKDLVAWEHDSIPPKGKERILLVEDRAEVRLMARRLLEGLGYQITEVDSALAALTAFDGGATFDLLFTDVVMPGGMGGIDLGREVRRRFPVMPIVFCSGFSNPARTAADVTALGASLIGKPYRKLDLARHLRAVLDRRTEL
jgi:two-component system cell cycle sensor histidine kinase/response regulator CckA